MRNSLDSREKLHILYNSDRALKGCSMGNEKHILQYEHIGIKLIIFQSSVRLFFYSKVKNHVHYRN